MHTVWLQTNPCPNGNLQEASACAFSLLVLEVLPIHLQGLHTCGIIHLSPSYIPSYVHVRPGYRENRLICKGHLSYTCNFITEFQGRTDPTMKIDMHIFPACMQYGHKCIHFSRVTYERLAHVHFSCECCKISPFIGRVAGYLHMLYNTLTCTLHPY